MSELARRIDAEHSAVATALQSALAHGINAGELLIEAKRQVQHGEWRPWLEANCSVPARTARHYMALARQRKRLCDENGNALPLSVHEAVEQLKQLRGRPYEGDYDPDEMEEFPGRNGPQICEWGSLSWGVPFADALYAVTRLPELKPPRPAYIAKAALAGKTPGLTAPVLRQVIALLDRYAVALEAADTCAPERAGSKSFDGHLAERGEGSCFVIAAPSAMLGTQEIDNDVRASSKASAVKVTGTGERLHYEEQRNRKIFRRAQKAPPHDRGAERGSAQDDG